MPALLALIPIKDWIYCGLLATLLIGFGAYTHHERVVGEAKVVAADAAATKKIVAQTAAQTAELKAKATMAEQAYDKEHTLIANQPVAQPVRLCVSTHTSGGVVPQTSGPKPGDASTGTDTSAFQSMSSRDSSGGEGGAGPDIAKLLQALAESADQVSAVLREYQGR